MVTGLRSTNCREARASSAPSAPHTLCTSVAGRSAVTACTWAPLWNRTIRSLGPSACGSTHHSAAIASARGREPTKVSRAAKRRLWVSHANSSKSVRPSALSAPAFRARSTPATTIQSRESTQLYAPVQTSAATTMPASSTLLDKRQFEVPEHTTDRPVHQRRSLHLKG